MYCACESRKPRYHFSSLNSKSIAWGSTYERLNNKGILFCNDSHSFNCWTCLDCSRLWEEIQTTLSHQHPQVLFHRNFHISCTFHFVIAHVSKEFPGKAWFAPYWRWPNLTRPDARAHSSNHGVVFGDMRHQKIKVSHVQSEEVLACKAIHSTFRKAFTLHHRRN